MKHIGYVELLRPRVYPLDPESPDVVTDAAVPAGRYPLYRHRDRILWFLTGQLNDGGFRSRGDGMFTVGPDEGVGPPVTFPSRSFSRQEWSAFKRDPVCVPGPGQRLAIHEEEDVSA